MSDGMSDYWKERRRAEEDAKIALNAKVAICKIFNIKNIKLEYVESRRGVLRARTPTVK